jgi:hypothetical protein
MAVDSKDRLVVGAYEIPPDGGTMTSSVVARIVP